MLNSSKILVRLFLLSAPFDLHLNLTLAPVARKDQCSFILCLGCIFDLEERRQCTVIAGKFEPWSLISPKGKVALTLTVTLLYGNSSCPNDLVKIISQPTSSKVESQFYTDLFASRYNSIYSYTLL